MRKLKVFLSKSKAGDFDTQVLTKKLLLEAGMEVFEYIGGDYSPDLMMSCDILVMVPARLKSNYNGKYCTIGKGQSDEIQNWLKGYNKTTKSIFIITEKPTDSRVTVQKIVQLYDKNEEDWKIAYKKVDLSSANIPLSIVGFVSNNPYLSLYDFYDYKTNPCAEIPLRGAIVDYSENINGKSHSSIQKCEDEVKPILACYARIRK
jgi:hypothetical protein